MNAPARRERYQTVMEGDSLTRQSFKHECDINNIVAKYQKTGAIDHWNNNAAQYQDVPAITYTEAMQAIAQANNLFNELPSSIREKFENDPSRFLDFVQNPDNAAEMHELGLSDQPMPGRPPDGPGHPNRRPDTPPGQTGNDGNGAASGGADAVSDNPGAETPGS